MSEEGINDALGGRKEGLSEKQWAAVRFAESMTKDVKVPKDVFEGIRRFLNDQQMVEITATVAALNCAARFLVALDVGEFDDE